MQPCAHPLLWTCPALSDSQPGTSTSTNVQESDVVFVAKLAFVSIAGGALLKWGSLLTPLASSANASVAWLLVVGVPLAYAATLLLRK